MILPFTFTGAKKIIFGKGKINNLPLCLEEIKAVRPLIVIDPTISALGVKEKLEDMLRATGIETLFFEDVTPEPEVAKADECARIAAEANIDSVVGIGGGSAMDIAKAISVLVPHKAKAEEFLGLDKVPGPGLPTVMVPTTAGTGSEVTFTAVFLIPELKKKAGINSPYLYPHIALLDPELTLTLPPMATATTGIDALSHAIESYTSINASPMSELFSLKAIELISQNLRIAVHNGSNIEARSQMLLGSLYAGLGLANAGVTAVHALSYPLGGRYGISHGLGNTILLPHVMAFNLPGAMEKFAHIATTMGEITDNLSIREAANLAVESVHNLIEDCGINISLEDLQVPEEDFETLAREALTVTRPLGNNPRKVDIEDAIEIYRAAW